MSAQTFSRRTWSGHASRLLRLRPRELRGLRWAWGALTSVRRDLPRYGVRTRAPRATRAPLSALDLVETLLRLRRATCLQRTLVVRELLLSHDMSYPIAVGVRRQDDLIAAHAWIPGFDPPSNGVDFQELTRIGAPSTEDEIAQP